MIDNPPAVLPWTRWELEPSIAVGLVVLLLAYLGGIGPLRPAVAQRDRVERARVAAFVGGLVTLFVALTGPLDDLADTFLFSAHMVQHLILTLVVPPLLLFGTPGWLLRPWVLGVPLVPLARTFTRPVVAFATFSVVLTAWHIPTLYSLALRNEGVHIAMHLMFIASGVIGWWPVMSPLPELPRLGYGMQCLYVALLGLPMAAVGALLTLADRVLFSYYAAAPRLWGLSPLVDQKLAGVIMWVPGHLAFVVALSIIFFRWAREDRYPRC